jgi:hypothetical protein
MATGVPLSVMAARVARRRPIMRVTKAGLGLRRGLYTGPFACACKSCGGR